MKTLQHPRGTTAENDAYTGPQSQVTVDKERWEIRLHDGATPGGHRILNLAQNKLIFIGKDSEFGNVAFAEGDRGFLVRVGDKEYALRTFEAGSGITLTNAEGVAGNPIIAIDEGALFGAFVGDTGGTPQALTIIADNLPATGFISFVARFAQAPAAGATLQVNDGEAYPLLTQHGNNKINRTAFEGTIGYFVRIETLDDAGAVIGAAYYMIGQSHPEDIGIDPIPNLAADNVQDALGLMAGGLGQGGGEGLFVKPHIFGEFTKIETDRATYTFTEADVSHLEPGQICLLGASPGSGGHDGGLTYPATTQEEYPFFIRFSYFIVKDSAGDFWSSIVPYGANLFDLNFSMWIADGEESTTIRDYTKTKAYAPKFSWVKHGASFSLSTNTTGVALTNIDVWHTGPGAEVGQEVDSGLDLSGFLNFAAPDGNWASGFDADGNGSITHTNIQIEDGEARGVIMRSVTFSDAILAGEGGGQTTTGGSGSTTYQLGFYIFYKRAGVYYYSQIATAGGGTVSGGVSSGASPSAVFDPQNDYRIVSSIRLGSTFSILGGTFWLTQKATQAD